MVKKCIIQWNNTFFAFSLIIEGAHKKGASMEQRALQNVNNCLNTDIHSYLETSGGQSSNLYLNVVLFFNTSVNWTSVAAYNSCFPA